MKRTDRYAYFWLGTSLALLVTWVPAAEIPQGRMVTLNIKMQPIASALNEFARQSGVQVLFYSDVGIGVSVTGLVGAFSPDAALTKLLSNTGLTYEYVNERTVAIHRVVSNVSEGAAVHGEPEHLFMRLANVQLAETPNEDQQIRSAASAQESGSNKRQVPPRSLEEVIVTAQKRAENIQDVPISIAVVTADDIDRRGLVSAEDYLRGIPGVSQMGGSGAMGGQAIVIRGMETSLLWQNFGSGPTTATYFGETPTTNSAGLSGGSNVDIKLVDIERVEVLRGPQGTAFGSSSLGGAVRTIPVAPKLDRFEGKVAAGYSVTSGRGGDNYNVQAVGNLPLIKDKLAIRATAYQYQDSGYYSNRAASTSNATFQTFVTTTGTQAFAVDEEEVGAYYVLGGRVAALFQATDDLRFTLNYLHQKTETDGFAVATSGPYEQTVLQVAPEHVRRGQAGGLVDYGIDIATATMEYDLGWADLLATYSDVKGDSVYVVPYQVFNLPWAASADRPMNHREQAGEIRLATKLDGAWNFLAGLYMEDLDDKYRAHLVWFGDPASSIRPGQRLLEDYNQRRDHQQKSAFGEVSWEFLPGFTLTGGVRAYEYDRTIRIERSGPLAGPNSLTDTKTSDTNYRANLSYKPDDSVLLYAGWAQGFRLGRPQPPLLASRCDLNGDGMVDNTNISLASTGQVDPDFVDNYELGGKFALLNRRLSVEASLFRMDWSGIPISISTPPPCLLGYLANAGEARSEGVEFQANFQLTDAFRVDLGGSYVHARLIDDAPSFRVSAGAVLPSPEVNANLGLQYEFDIAGHAAFVRADATHVASFSDNISQPPNSKTDGYVKLDASARVAIANLNVDFFVRNLTNEDAFTYRGGLIYSEFFGYRLRPRTIGVQLSYDFGE